MAITVTVNTTILNDSMGSAGDAREYMSRLRTDQVQFLNGPESPGPCLACLGYHGTVWNRMDASRPIEPLHPHCYCRSTTYRDGGDIVSDARRYQPIEFLQERVGRLSLHERELLMGQGRARLHRIGIIETSDLVNKAEGIVNLQSHLQRKLGVTVKRFNAMTDRELIERFNEFKVSKHK